MEESRAWPASTQEWFVAQGHYAGTSEALVRISPNAVERYRQHTGGAEFPPGTTLVMLHRQRSTREPGPIHVMQRAKSGWDYLLLDAGGAIVEDADLARCARCHAEAVSDSVFGPPREGVE